MSKLYIITVITHEDGYIKYLMKSVKKYGAELIILGYGQKWKGFNWRLFLINDYIKNLDSDDIICVVDGFDVLCLRNLEELKYKFIEFYNKSDYKIIISENKYFYNNLFSEYINQFYFGNCNKLFLNAGVYIGYVKDIKFLHEQLKLIDKDQSSDDQIIFTEYCNLNNKFFFIDTNNEYFLTINNPYKEIDHLITFINENNGEISLVYNNNTPFFIHGNGETYLDNIIIKLGYHYDYENKINEKLEQNFYNKLYFRILNNKLIKNIIVIIVIILFCLVLFLKKKT